MSRRASATHPVRPEGDAGKYHKVTGLQTGNGQTGARI